MGYLEEKHPMAEGTANPRTQMWEHSLSPSNHHTLVTLSCPLPSFPCWPCSLSETVPLTDL